jgi:hypothetical protein
LCSGVQSSSGEEGSNECRDFFHDDLPGSE